MRTLRALTAHLPRSHLEASIDDGLQALDEPVSARLRPSCRTSLDGVKMPLVGTHCGWNLKDAPAQQKVGYIIQEEYRIALTAPLHFK